MLDPRSVRYRSVFFITFLVLIFTYRAIQWIWNLRSADPIGKLLYEIHKSFLSPRYLHSNELWHFQWMNEWDEMCSNWCFFFALSINIGYCSSNNKKEPPLAYFTRNLRATRIYRFDEGQKSKATKLPLEASVRLVRLVHPPTNTLKQSEINWIFLWTKTLLMGWFSLFTIDFSTLHFRFFVMLHYYLPTHASAGNVERSFVFVSTVGLITVIELHFFFVSASYRR